MNLYSNVFINVIKALGNFFIIGYHAYNAILTHFPNLTVIATTVLIILEGFVLMITLTVLIKIFQLISAFLDAKRNMKK